MAARVSRRRNRKQILFKRNVIPIPQRPLDTRKRAAYVVAMHHSPGVEVARPTFVVRNVVPVCKKHQSYAAKLFDASDQWARESRRVDQHVPLRPDDQVTRCAVTRLRSEAAEVDVLIDSLRIGCHGLFRQEMINRAD